MRGLVILCILLMGCASTPPVPPNFDFARANIVPGDKDPEVDIDGLSGKESGAAVGGASGAGIGLGYAAIACMPAFMFYGACLAVAAPVLGGIGAVSGAAVGAVATQSAASVEEKREMLNEALVAIDARNYLATLMTQQFQQGDSVVTLASDTISVPVQPSWTLRIALNEVSTDGAGEESSYFLKASAVLEVMQTDQEKSFSRKEYHTQTRDRKTTVEWLANKDQPVPTVIESLLTTLASDMLKDLLPNQMGKEHQLEVHPLYANNNSKGTKPAATSPLDSKQINGSTVLQTVNHDDENLALFDPTTGINWVVVNSYPVDLGTANNICKKIDTGDKRKYRLPSLNEFKELWKSYKADRKITVFNKKEYSTRDEDTLTSYGYTKTFSLDNGTSGNLYAAYLSCVSK